MLLYGNEIGFVIMCDRKKNELNERIIWEHLYAWIEIV